MLVVSVTALVSVDNLYTVLQPCSPLSTISVTHTKVTQAQETVTAVNLGYRLVTAAVTRTKVLTSVTDLVTQLVTVMPQPSTRTSKISLISTTYLYQEVPNPATYDARVTETCHLRATEVAIRVSQVTKTKTHERTVTESRTQVYLRTLLGTRICQDVALHVSSISRSIETKYHYTTVSVLSTRTVTLPIHLDNGIRATRAILNEKVSQCSVGPTHTKPTYLRGLTSWARKMIGLEKLENMFTKSLMEDFVKRLSHEEFEVFVEKESREFGMPVKPFNIKVGIQLPIIPA